MLLINEISEINIIRKISDADNFNFMKKTGADYQGNGRCTFRVWSPLATSVSLQISEPTPATCPMQPEENGYFSVILENIEPYRTLYLFNIDNRNALADPASHHQPYGVFSASQVIDHQDFTWTDENWQNIPLNELIIYELHVGTFSPEGTFSGILSRLDYLLELGINAIELLPIAQFSGTHNWGYDGVFPYAVHNTYGTPHDLKRLVNTCHEKGIAVILDTVYNHLGPEGNYLPQIAPYMSQNYLTPWGFALNFDGAYSDEVRRFYIDNASYWLEKFHIDGMRQDAAHLVFDLGVKHIWQEITNVVHEKALNMGKPFYMFAETSRNDTRFIEKTAIRGFGFDGLWLDDFHHALRTVLSGEKGGYYADFGKLTHLAKAFQAGFVIDGVYSQFRKKKMGNSSVDFSGENFIVFVQNHDQVGNRPGSSRLAADFPPEVLYLVSGVYLLSPYIPMLFMGEEYGEKAPFYFFTNHTDPILQQNVRTGRMKEYAGQGLLEGIADPQAIETFLQSKINPELRHSEPHASIWNWYKTLIFLRKTHPVLKDLDKKQLQVKQFEEKILYWQRSTGKLVLECLMNFSNQEMDFKFPENENNRPKKLFLDSYEKQNPVTDFSEKLIKLRPYQLLLLESSTENES